MKDPKTPQAKESALQDMEDDFDDIDLYANDGYLYDDSLLYDDEEDYDDDYDYYSGFGCDYEDY